MDAWPRRDHKALDWKLRVVAERVVQAHMPVFVHLFFEKPKGEINAVVLVQLHPFPVPGASYLLGITIQTARSHPS